MLKLGKQVRQIRVGAMPSPNPNVGSRINAMKDSDILLLAEDGESTSEASARKKALLKKPCYSAVN